MLSSATLPLKMHIIYRIIFPIAIPLALFVYVMGSSFLFLRRFFLLLRLFFFDLLELVSFDKLDFFDESDNDGSGSGSPGKSVGNAGESIGSVRGVGLGGFVLGGIESHGDVVLLVVFVLRGVKSKGG